ncbi:MAG: NADPH:quinone reductase-like Zn-dependent oxidoreductase [Flammeovirgaceae bacterium]|jgi:zinc-binding alcohol dehydrogenase/oxidoreductase
MLALQLQDNPTETLVLQEVETPKIAQGKALVKMKTASLNHRDQWIREGKYPGIQFDTTLGSDGCGVVVSVGSEQDSAWVDEEVIINPNINWGESLDFQGEDYRILGNPDNGTFAEYLVIDIDRLEQKPAHLTSEEAAALPLGGLTAFRATFTQAEVNADDTVLISGFGGGVAQFAFQFAIAVGAKVFVTSGSEEKITKAISLGALGGANYKEEDWHKRLQNASGGFTKIIDSAGGDQMNLLIRLLKPAGRLVFYGATLGLPENLDLHKIFFKQLRIQGSTMGSDHEFSEMLDFVESNKIRPLVDSIVPFKKIITAFDKMQAGNQLGKIVISIEDKTQVKSSMKQSVSKVKDFFSGIFKKKESKKSE